MGNRSLSFSLNLENKGLSIPCMSARSKSMVDYMGGSRIFFRRRCTRLLLYFNTNKPRSFLGGQNTSCIRKPQVISGGGGAHPLHPPPRSAPGLKSFLPCFRSNNNSVLNFVFAISSKIEILFFPHTFSPTCFHFPLSPVSRRHKEVSAGKRIWFLRLVSLPHRRF